MNDGEQEHNDLREQAEEMADDPNDGVSNLGQEGYDGDNDELEKVKQWSCSTSG